MCGSHILCCVLNTLHLCTNMEPRCASTSITFGTSRSMCVCDTGASRYSVPARIVRPERVPWTDDFKYYARMTTIRSVANCKHRTRPCLRSVWRRERRSRRTLHGRISTSKIGSPRDHRCQTASLKSHGLVGYNCFRPTGSTSIEL